MRKIKALIRYEMLDLKRSPIFWVMIVLYLFTLQQIVSNLNLFGENFLNLIGFNKDSWLIINFLMIPILYISFKIGKSKNEIITVSDIGKGQYIVSKLLTIFIINVVIIVINLVIFLFIALINKISTGYLINNITTFSINMGIVLFVCSSVGFCIGVMVNKYIGDILSYLLIIGLFIRFSNFSAEPKGIFPLIFTNTIESNFYVNGYEKIYLYHNYFWIIIALTLVLISLIIVYLSNEKTKLLLSILLIITGAYLGINYLNEMKELTPTYLNIYSREESENISNEKEINIRFKKDIFYSDDNCGYYVSDYLMNIDLGEELSNECKMNIVIEKDNTDSLEFGLYNSLNIEHIKNEDRSIGYTRKENSFIVNLPKTLNKGEVVNLSVTYKGKINTVGVQAKRLFYVGKTRLFVGDVFAWYPKQNDNKEKNYEIKVNYSGDNELYSNLDGVKNNSKYEFVGIDKEVMLISGDIKSKNYNGIEFIGNEEYINNKAFCDEILMISKQNSKKSIDKIIVGPFILGTGIKMQENYENAYFFGEL